MVSNAYLELVAMPTSELRRQMLRGEPPDPAELAGEYRGTNMPATSRLLGIRRFVKGFVADAGETTGYNRRVPGASLSSPWTTTHWFGKERFGFFTVSRVDPRSRDNAYLNALLLNYGEGPNPRADISRLLRDFVVRTESGVLLGHAFAAVAGRRVPVGYFALEPL